MKSATKRTNKHHVESAIDDDELGALVAMDVSSGPLDDEDHKCNTEKRWEQLQRFGVLLVIVVLFLWVLIQGRSVPAIHVSHSKNEGAIHFECPAGSFSTVNLDDEATEDYVANGTQPCTDTPACFLETFRDHIFDGHKRTYTEFKETNRQFVKDFFVPNLKSGDSIYESACGVGLSLFALLEILQEEGNLTGFTVYGNEYIDENADKANWILDVLLNAPKKGTKSSHHPRNKQGRVCRGDSTDLRSVPSNSFDLVFTGYISPLFDPLNLNSHSKMKKLCKDPDWRAELLVNVSQSKQEEWFNQWVEEMIRIAKPGAPIIIEENALPFCENPHDYGGVDQNYWRHGIQQFGWDVNLKSIQFGTRGNGYTGSRYHVFMRKNSN